MGRKSGTAIEILTILLIGNCSSAFANEKLSSVQTALSNTTISGFVSSEITYQTVEHGILVFRPEPQIVVRSTPPARISQSWLNDDSSLFGFETTPQPSGSIDTDWQNPSVDLPTAQPVIENADYDTGVIDYEYFRGVITEETIEQVTPMQAFLTPPDLQLSSSQSEVQAVPEPTTFAFCGLALALGALARLNRR
jgi:hypothetical protein